ncbi:hypothetical protein BT69DRAFT_906330 [Atractiella rhizophila]|nr:hypothetical protein BT69DRAFT_906330 [Atractiella rhizophila]
MKRFFTRTFLDDAIRSRSFSRQSSLSVGSPILFCPFFFPILFQPSLLIFPHPQPLCSSSLSTYPSPKPSICTCSPPKPVNTGVSPPFRPLRNTHPFSFVSPSSSLSSDSVPSTTLTSVTLSTSHLSPECSRVLMSLSCRVDFQVR